MPCIRSITMSQHTPPRLQIALFDSDRKLSSVSFSKMAFGHPSAGVPSGSRVTRADSLVPGSIARIGRLCVSSRFDSVRVVDWKLIEVPVFREMLPRGQT